MPSITLVWTPGWPNIPTGAGPEFVNLERKITEVLKESRQTIKLTKILLLAKGVKLITETEQCIEELYSNYITKSFQTYCGLTFQPSRERVAGCTLVIKPYNDYVFELSDEDVLTSVRRAAGITEEIPVNLWREKEKKLIKITFTQKTHAQRAKDNGIGMGGIFFPSRNIEFGEHIPLLQCMRCFAFEDHTTQNCKAAKATCSECGREGHSYLTCVRPTPPRCINCQKKGYNADHRALANSCQTKKEVMKMKRNQKKEEKQNEEHLPVIQAVQNTIAEIMAPEREIAPTPTPRAWPEVNKNNKNKRKKTPPKPFTSTTLSLPPPGKRKKKNPDEKSTKITQLVQTLIIMAHHWNVMIPGTFNTKLNEYLARNNLPEADVGEDQPSSEILQALGVREQEQSETEMEDEPSIMRTSAPTTPIAPTATIMKPSWIDQAIQSQNTITLYNELLEMERVIGKEETIGKEEKQEKKKPKRKKKRRKKDKKGEEQETDDEKKQETESTKEEESQETESTEEEESQTETETETDEESEVENHYEISYLFNSETPTFEGKEKLYKFYREWASFPEGVPEHFTSGIAYWVAFEANKVMLEEEALLGGRLDIDVHVELQNGGMTEKEIIIKEEKYIEKSIEKYGVLPSSYADIRRMLRLAGKGAGELYEEESRELRKLTKEIAQRRLEELPRFVQKCLITTYRTTGLVHTLDQLVAKNEKFRFQVEEYRLEQEEAKNLQQNSCEF